MEKGAVGPRTGVLSEAARKDLQMQRPFFCMQRREGAGVGGGVGRGARDDVRGAVSGAEGAVAADGTTAGDGDTRRSPLHPPQHQDLPPTPGRHKGIPVPCPDVFSIPGELRYSRNQTTAPLMSVPLH